MNRFQLYFGLALVAASASSQAYSTFGTKWGLGVHVATHLAGHEGTPGMLMWSIMPAGLGIVGLETHFGALTSDFGSLIGGSAGVEEIAIITAVFETWASVCGLTVVGPVVDGMVPGGAPHAIGGGMGDIRFGLLGGFGSPAELGHAYLPGTEFLFGPSGSLTGDVHINVEKTWVDDPFDLPGDGIYDLHTVLLHEVGHALGLAHSDVPGAVMAPTYAGAKRALAADDIEGITYIYGPVPEPASLAALGLGALLLLKRRRNGS